MFRKTLLACAIALPLGLVGTAPAALADTGVRVYFGVPFYTYQVRPRYVYYENYGWYDPYRYPRLRHRADDDYVSDYEYYYDDYYDNYYDGDYVVIRRRY